MTHSNSQSLDGKITKNKTEIVRPDYRATGVYCGTRSIHIEFT